MLFAVGSVIIGCTDKKVHVLADSLKSAARNFILTKSIQKAECASDITTPSYVRTDDGNLYHCKSFINLVSSTIVNFGELDR